MDANKYENYSVLMSVYFKEKPEYLKTSIESMMNRMTLCLFAMAL